MKAKRKWSALRLKKQYVYAQFDEAPKLRYKSISVVTDWLDHWEHPRYCRRHWGSPQCWKGSRHKQYNNRK